LKELHCLFVTTALRILHCCTVCAYSDCLVQLHSDRYSLVLGA